MNMRKSTVSGTSPKNTLLNYFTRSPAAAAVTKNNRNVTNVSTNEQEKSKNSEENSVNENNREATVDQQRSSADGEKTAKVDQHLPIPSGDVASPAAVGDKKVAISSASTKRTRTRQATPKQTKRPKVNGDEISTPVSRTKNENGTNDDEEEDDNVAATTSPPRKRRRRIICQLDSDDDGNNDAADTTDEYKPNDANESDDNLSSSLSEESFEASDSQHSDDEDDDDEVRKKKDTRKPAVSRSNKKVSQKNTASGVPTTVSTPRLSSKESLAARFTSTPASLTNGTDNGDCNGSGNDTCNWPHLKLDFLKPDKIRDTKRRLASDPNYDPRTLYVPEDFKNKLTPAVRQWWEMKSKYFDVVLFFKVGKFYELYHMDAVIAANELSLTFMRGEFAHVGFPEVGYGRFSSTLVEKGYKVARVEQTETPDMMAERVKAMSTKSTKFDKVVKREICQITSRGTRIFGVLDGETKEAESNYLLAVVEKETDSSSGQYGVCFVDTSIGVFYVAQFVDDRHLSRLRTLIAHYTPVQILIEKNRVGERINSLLNTACSGIVKESLSPDSEFLSASQTLLELTEKYYRNDDAPAALAKFLNQAPNETLAHAAITAENELGIRAVGAVVWYLQRSLIDHHLFTMARFELYEPIDGAKQIEPRVSSRNSDGGSKSPNDKRTSNMILDAVTLKNLEILHNSQGGVHGSLLHVVDNCCTAFGKRLLQRWMCNPSADIDVIETRQEAVQYLSTCPILEQIRTALGPLPDLERLLTKIYSQSSKGIRESHPDTRAFLFEEKIYTKKKIVDFISTLKGFKNVVKIVEQFEEFVDEQDAVAKIPRLISRHLTTNAKNPNGAFPQLTDSLEFFEKAFDHEHALKEGRILPSVGTDVDYDRVVEELKIIEKDSNRYLNEQRSYFGLKVNFVGADKKRFQLEVAESATKRANSKYELTGQRKGFKRYVTQETRQFLDRIIAAEEQKKNVLKNLRQRVFAKFCEKFTLWIGAIRSISVIDILVSFAQYRINRSTPTCMPQFYRSTADQSERQPFVYLEQGRYPCSNDDESFIPNDTFIGRFNNEDGDVVSDASSLIIVTGPNMGGKSTLMRQLGLIVIMAHMGCYVPAIKLKLSVVDRIFTRLGANDDIMAGESTFYVELCETSCILQHATRQSLVLIDELGRGTSTYDGTAIASAVLNELCRIECRTLFSTHYHKLVENFKNNPSVTLGHMACMVETENKVTGDDDNDDADEKSDEACVTFLHKFAKGACPKSYGFNAARLAGMPKSIIKLGLQRAKQLEAEISKRNLFKTMFKSEQRTRELIEAI